jgi:hypothetical protein
MPPLHEDGWRSPTSTPKALATEATNSAVAGLCPETTFVSRLYET